MIVLIGRGAKPTVENYAYRECDTPEITDDDILVQTLYLCMDPALVRTIYRIYNTYCTVNQLATQQNNIHKI